MFNFKDNKGAEWRIPRLTLGAIKVIEAATGINIYRLAEKKGELLGMVFDPFQFGAVLWCLCEEQAKTRNVSPDDFAFLFDATAMESAGEAFLEAITDFFPRAKVSQGMRANLRKSLANVDDALLSAWSKPSTEPSAVPASANGAL